LTYIGEVIEYWTIFSLIRSSRNCRGIACALSIVGSPQWGRFNEGYLDFFRPNKLLFLNSFLWLKIQLNYKNGFGRKNSLANKLTLGLTTHATLVQLN
jgi:hypothetical protein